MSLESYDGDPFNGDGTKLAEKLENASFGYLGAGDRRLIQDAVYLECDAFLTMERKLPKNAGHIERELGIRVNSNTILGTSKALGGFILLTPADFSSGYVVDFWEIVRSQRNCNTKVVDFGEIGFILQRRGF